MRLVLEAAFPSHRWQFDRAFAVGVRKRPDAKVVEGDRVIIVEVDEHSHRLYGCDKERERERIFVHHASKKQVVVMCRFNPDKYTTDDGKRIPSCFRVSGEKGLVSLNPKRTADWDRRCNNLVHWVRSFLDPTCGHYVEHVPEPEPGRPLFSEELFYDTPMTEAAKRATTDAYARAAKRQKVTSA